MEKFGQGRLIHSKLFWSLAFVLTAFIWGFAFVVVKDSLDVVPTMHLLAFRFSIAFIGLIIIFHKRLSRTNRQNLIQGIILGFFLFSSYALQTYGCKYTTAGKNAFLTTIYVILVPFLSFLIFRKRVNRWHIFSAVLCVIGIALLTLKAESGVNIGDILTLCCGFTFAVHIVYIDRFTLNSDPVLLTIFQMGTVALISWISAFVFEGNPFAGIQYSGNFLISMLYLGLLSTLLGFLIQTVGLKYMHPVTATVILSLESVFGVLCSAIFLQEEISLRMLAGCALMFVAIIIAEVLGEDKQGDEEISGHIEKDVGHAS
ncbi:MAG: DMT family transporter [Lachnospiraceae bacterium]|nr:DMT family transporter [Lachnospiraceae bacterium]